MDVVLFIAYIFLALFVLLLVDVIYFAVIYPEQEFAILETLSRRDKMAGRELRSLLWTEAKYFVSLGQFYQMMSLLEERKLVQGWYEKHHEFPEVKVRWYKLLEKGYRRHHGKLLARMWMGMKGLAGVSG